MTEQIEKILDELKAIQAKLPELRDLFWLKIDRYRESDQQRGLDNINLREDLSSLGILKMLL